MKLFISYSHRDSPFVNKLVADLKARLEDCDIDIWIDTAKIHAGASIVSGINEGLRGADYYLLVLSNSSVESRWVTEELDAAIVKGIEKGGTFVLPLLIESCAVPPLLAAKKHIDFRSSYDSRLAELCSFLRYEARIEIGRAHV